MSSKPVTAMYDDAKTWNPFKGCQFDCTYCVPSFQKQAKRQRQRCGDCYRYQPHRHEERLKKIPSAPIVFVCGNSDVSFCDHDYLLRILDAIRHHNRRCPHKTYYLQSKRPEYFQPLLPHLPQNVILVTTLETNRDEGYDAISKAPPPSERYRQFKMLDYPRKVVTLEPLLAFDPDIFLAWIRDLQPEYVWLGFNSKPRSVQLPEPSREEVLRFAESLTQAGITVREKDLRRDEPPGSERPQVVPIPDCLPAAEQHLRTHDPVLGSLMDTVGPCTLTRAENRFEVLVESIVYQRISVPKAARLWEALQRLVGPEGMTAANLARFSEQQLGAAGLPPQKAARVAHLAAQVHSGRLDLEAWDRLTDREVIQRLCQIDGIGRWTAEMFLIFCLGRPNVFPAGDHGVVKTIKRHYSLPETANNGEIRQIARRWQPYASVATWYIWRMQQQDRESATQGA